MFHKEDLCKEIEEGEGKEIYMKLSVIPATKRDISVAIVLSTRGTNQTTLNKTGPHDRAKDAKLW